MKNVPLICRLRGNKLWTAWCRTTKNGLRVPERPGPEPSRPGPLGVRAERSRPPGERPPRRHTYGEVEPDGRVMDAMTNIRREFIEEFADNTNRHELGIGLIGHCLGLQRKSKIDADVQQQLDVIGAKIHRRVIVLTHTLLPSLSA